jgi:hypothetical protein
MPGLYTHADCANQHRLEAGTELHLTSPVEEDGVTLFRRTLYLQLALDDRSSGIGLSPDSQLQLRFEPTTVNITRTDNAWVKTWDAQGERIDVELSYPAPILSLQSQLYSRVAVYRVDGEAVSEQATVTANAGQVFPEPLVAPVFQVELLEPHAADYAVAVAEMLQAMHSQAHQSLSAMATIDAPARAPRNDVAQLRREVFLQSGLSSIALQGQATNPRLRLLNEDGSEVLWQWLEAGVHSDSVTFPQQGESLVELLAPALGRAFGQRAADSNAILLPLLIESDTPCHLVVDQANLAFLLEAELIPEPFTYSFDGSREETQVLPLEPPAGAPHSLYFAASLDLTQAAWETTPPGISVDTELTGISLAKGDWVAVPFKVDQPVKLSGLAIAWYGLAEDSDLEIAISEDSGNRPAAKARAQASLVKTVDKPEWLHFRCNETALQPGPYWIGLRLLAGSGIWLGQSCLPAQLAWRSNGNQPAHSEPLPLQLYIHPLTSAADESAASAPIQISLNGTTLTYSPPADNQIVSDWVSISAALQALPAWNFTLTSGQSLIFTIKSILLRYAV